MATTSNKHFDALAGNFTSAYKDRITQNYIIEFDAKQSSPLDVFVAGQLASPDPVPLRGEFFPGTLLLAKRFSVTPLDGTRLVWMCAVVYETPEPGEDQDQQNTNPLLRPPILNVEYIETERVITKARNVVDLPHGNGFGGSRAASTEGPIVNAAGKRPDEPVVDTDRNAVLTIQRNYSTLSQIVALNQKSTAATSPGFKGTTNSDTPDGFGARTLKYLLTDSQGLQTENDIVFWTGITRIEVKDTTDLILDNVGYEYWDDTRNESDWVRAKDGDGELVADPINLKLDGDKGGDTSTTITWRHLTDKAYASLLS